MNDEDVIVALIYKINTPISYTKLQKLTFLLKEETNIKLSLEFKPYKYGPFSQRVFEITEKLRADGLVSISYVNGLPTQTDNIRLVSITEQGRKKGGEVYNSMDEEQRDSFDSVIRRWGSEPLSSLLVYTYLTYPETTKNSTIADKILS